MYVDSLLLKKLKNSSISTDIYRVCIDPVSVLLNHCRRIHFCI